MLKRMSRKNPQTKSGSPEMREFKFKTLIYWLSVVVSFWALLSCGVKGDPLPPEKPPELGRGKPNYRGATEEIELPELPPVMLHDDYDEEGDED